MPILVLATATLDGCDPLDGQAADEPITGAEVGGGAGGDVGAGGVVPPPPPPPQAVRLSDKKVTAAAAADRTNMRFTSAFFPGEQ